MIRVGNGIRHQLHEFLNKSYSSILIITDKHVEKLYLEEIEKALQSYPVHVHVIPSGEASKHVEVYYDALTTAIQKGLDRNSLIVALGGGVVGDLAGFVAATFMRGIDYIQVPTTILAHDSSVGGKVAINHELGKNLIGAFYAPVGVVFDMETLRTLPKREKRSGYAELIKEALIDSEELVDTVLSESLDSIQDSSLQEIIISGIKVKQEIVEKDEMEHGVRSYLNLGHTLAHALEKELGYGEITHGEAVAAGLLFSMHVSEQMNGNQLPFHELRSWLQSNNYPLETIPFHHDKLLRHMKSDKKAVKQRIKMVLLNAPGELYLEEIPDERLLAYMQSFKERLMK
jgi:3-dehydroquinate synthase